MNWTIERQGPVTAKIKTPYRQTEDWEQWVLLSADRHHDNPHSDRKLQHHHMGQAVDRDAIVIDIGDTFDAMQGKRDPRSNKGDLDPALNKGAYLNHLVEMVTEFYKPYGANVAMIGEGNHETAKVKNEEYSLLDGLIFSLHQAGHTHIHRGGYRGWLRFAFEHEAGGGRQSINAYYHHGSGGGGPVTKGIIQTNRRSTYLPDANIVLTGHIHEEWVFPVTRVRLRPDGHEEKDTQHHVQLPTYKEEYLDMPGGFHHETGKPPKPTGATWMRFYYSRRTGRVEVSFTPADK